MNFTIQEIKGIENILQTHSLLMQLQEKLKKEDMNSWLKIMLPMGYRMFGIFEKEKPVGCTGIWTGAKFYCGKYMEIDNFVIDSAYRSNGAGKSLCDFTIDLAKKENCNVVMLDAYTSNNASHKFYLREGFVIKGFHFIKEL